MKYNTISHNDMIENMSYDRDQQTLTKISTQQYGTYLKLWNHDELNGIKILEGE